MARSRRALSAGSADWKTPLALTKTVGGVRSYAIGGDARAAGALGVDVPRHLVLLYVYMGGSIGLVALLTYGRLGSASPNLGSGFEIAVITAVISNATSVTPMTSPIASVRCSLVSGVILGIVCRCRR